MGLGIKPKEAIRKYNKLGGKKITNNSENCKKLSQFKWLLKQKQDENMPDILNVQELESWLKSKALNLNLETLIHYLVTFLLL